MCADKPTLLWLQTFSIYSSFNTSDSHNAHVPMRVLQWWLHQLVVLLLRSQLSARGNAYGVLVTFAQPKVSGYPAAVMPIIGTFF